ncbi:MAG: hypothetical protein ACLVK8_00195 [Ruminococcus sp.]
MKSGTYEIPHIPQAPPEPGDDDLCRRLSAGTSRAAGIRMLLHLFSAAHFLQTGFSFVVPDSIKPSKHQALSAKITENTSFQQKAPRNLIRQHHADFVPCCHSSFLLYHIFRKMQILFMQIFFEHLILLLGQHRTKPA